MVSDKMTWRSRAYEPGGISWQAQQFGLLLERQGLTITEGSDLDVSGVIGWGELVQAFANVWDASIEENRRLRQEKEADTDSRVEENSFPIESSYHWARRLMVQIQQGPRSLEALADEFRAAMAAAVDEYVRDQAKYAELSDTHEGLSDSPEEAQETPHRNSAQSIIVHFNDGSERIMHTHHPIIQNGGWKVRSINGVPFFILGHGVPRQMIPLCNVKSIDLSEELL